MSDEERLLAIDVTLRTPDISREEWIESDLWSVSAGFEREDDETFSNLREEPRPRPPGSVRWRFHLPFGAEADAYAAVVAALDAHIDVADVQVATIDASGYRDDWKRFFEPTQVSPRLFVHPPWKTPEMGPRAFGIEIDPGMAFGTGTHETTRLCLAAIDALDPTGATVLDAGTGSGILSIGALLLGAQSATGVDIDPDAITEAIRNAEVNGVADRAAFSTDAVDTIDGVFSLVIANILPHILRALRDPLVDRLAPNGALLLSGVLVGQADDISQHYAARGLREVARHTIGEWSMLRMERVEAA